MDKEKSMGLKPEISVIIPVYNTASFLEGCIDSITVQTFTDFELLLVDDGSTDGSSAICDRKAKEDTRIKCIHQKNQGQQDAVRKGISQANGNWLCFVDSDDRLTTDALEILFSNAKNGSDIIVAFSFPGNGNTETISIEDWRAKMFRGSEVLCTRWGKLFQRSLFDDDSSFVPPEVRVGEDMIMNIKLAFRTEKPVTIINKQVYLYNRNADSVSATYRWTADRYAVLFDNLLKAVPVDRISAESKNLYLSKICENGISMIQSLLTFDHGKGLRSLSSSRLVNMVNNEIENVGHELSFEDNLACHHPSWQFSHWFFIAKRFLIIAVQSVKRRLRL
ncbi:MAG: glycosyltransferase family 2 protein [Bacteroidales bacterium]|nr:glycosyltransferase family 2 protein [Bacteroidales bacterium]